MLHLRGKVLSSRRVYQVVLLLIFILFPNAMSPSLKLSSSSSLPLCPQPLIKLCWVTWDPWCFITRTGFAQALHHWDPGNANPPTTSFPLRHLCLLQFPYSFSHNSFLPRSLLKGLRTFSLFFTSDECVKRKRSESYGHTEVFLKCRIPPPPALRWNSADLYPSKMQAPYRRHLLLYLFSMQ